MSFLEKARKAAAEAAEQIGQAAQGPSQPGAPGWVQPVPEQPPAGADASAAPPPGVAAGFAAHAEDKVDWSKMGAQFKDAASKAKSGLVTAIEKIDPAILADIIIKATAIQETANRSLRAKGSAYRIGEITITATIPPQIGFSIERIGDVDDGEPMPEQVVPAEQLAAEAEAEGVIVSLEGEAAPG